MPPVRGPSLRWRADALKDKRREGVWGDEDLVVRRTGTGALVTGVRVR